MSGFDSGVLMGEPLTGMERIFRLGMILLGVAGAAYLAHRLITGSLENDTSAVPVLRTSAVVEGPAGHGYQYVAAPGVSWDFARDAARGHHWHGMTGYLATIDNEAEFDFIVSTAFSRQYPDVTYLGGRQTAAGEWRWVTGPDAIDDGGKGRLFWKGYENGSVQPGAFAHWMATAFSHGGKWDVRNVCCVTLFSYHRPQFSTSLGNGDRDEGVSGYLVEFSR
ncbi:MAG: hypothetical protein BGN85_04220 [Alphaproteobacteria bacterium 64-11]|nr:hypothetical protein [Alphaproteobacteria bacterium]OJU09743.1 MAG: hypothetical protein BGN85_04220 [Alphaproteobacteria bacterium 64-11]